MANRLIVHMNPKGDYPGPHECAKAILKDSGKLEIYPPGRISSKNPCVVCLISERDYPIKITAERDS